MPIAKVHQFQRPGASEAADLTRRAVVAYLATDGTGAMPAPERSGVRMLRGLGYVVLKAQDGTVLAVYRIRSDNGLLRRLRRWPAMVVR